jgi:thioredoxin reductase
VKARYDIAVVGAGPAGMAAATEAAGHGAHVLLFDEQSGPGGQVYRAVTRSPLADGDVLGPDYRRGRELAAALASSGAEHVPGATVWQISSEREIGVSVDGASSLVRADQIIIATGAQERPFPIPGWTLPGVMGAGGAQALLKSTGLAEPQAVFAGTGPLLYLVANQYLQAGVPIRAILDTTPRANMYRALAHLPAALLSGEELAKGRRWITALRRAGIPFIKGVDGLKLSGTDRLSGVEYRRHGRWSRIDTDSIFLHQGVVPNVNLAMATGCTHRWSDGQLCWHGVTDQWGETNLPGIAIAGDGAAINGAVAAGHVGRIAALGALHRCERLDSHTRDRLATPIRRALTKATRGRTFLDVLFRPAPQFRIPGDGATLVCRCEEVDAARIRESAALGCVDPNQVKGLTRCGMGLCQSRSCGLTVSEIIASVRGVHVSEVGALRLRAPVKPLALEELAALSAENPSSREAG